MTEIERQILLNQYVTMAFLHGTHLGELSFLNEASFESLRKCMELTKVFIEQGDKQHE